MKKIFKNLDDCVRQLRKLKDECQKAVDKAENDGEIHLCAALDWISDSADNHIGYWENQIFVLNEASKEQKLR
jgi:hypothetical protein